MMLIRSLKKKPQLLQEAVMFRDALPQSKFVSKSLPHPHLGCTSLTEGGGIEVPEYELTMSQKRQS